MYSIGEIKQICKELDIQLTKSKGQNFLINESVRDRIIQAADLKGDETVLEIGPGLGALTEELIKKSKVIAVELDKKLYGYLKSKKLENLELVQGDILNFLRGENKFAKVVANLPYQITSHILRVMLEKNVAEELIVMVQKEVGERIVAKPGKMSILSVMVQYYSEPQILFKVSKGNFWPRPKVDSAVVKLKVKSLKFEVDEDKLFRIIKIGFSAKRKMLKNNLAGVYAAEQVKRVLKKIGLAENVRAQELSTEQWLNFYTQLGKS